MGRGCEEALFSEQKRVFEVPLALKDYIPPPPPFHKWFIPRIVRSVCVRSKWAGLGAQKGTPSAPQPMSSECQRFPIISYEIPSREKVLRRPCIVAVTKEWGRAFPECTIGEGAILGGRNFIRPLPFIHPPPLEGYVRGWGGGGWGCIKLGPVDYD